jgi:hypothetical protein
VLDAQHAGAERAGQLVAAAAAGAAGRAGALVGRRSGRRGQLRAHAERAAEQAATAAPTAAAVGVVVLVFRLRRHGAEGAQRRRRADGEATAGQTVPRQFCLVAIKGASKQRFAGRADASARLTAEAPVVAEPRRRLSRSSPLSKTQQAHASSEIAHSRYCVEAELLVALLLSL